jgi:hypothetical protein
MISRCRASFHVASGAALLWLVLSTPAGSAPGPARPVREVANMPTAPYPRYEVVDHGYRAWVSTDINGLYGRDIELHDREGVRLYNRSVPVPGGEMMRIRDVAVSSSGFLAAIGPWNDSDNTGSMP